MNFVASIYGLGPWRGRRLRRLLEFVELDQDRGKLARGLSGGMQRRLSLAATLAHNPDLLFLDEPTVGIDPVLRRKFWDYFTELKSQGRTLFITTQYVGEAAYCDLVGVMAEGRLLVVDTPAGLRRLAFGGSVVLLRGKDLIQDRHVHALRQLPFVRQARYVDPVTLRLVVEEASTGMPRLLNWAQAEGVAVEKIEEYLPPFDDIFVELVRKEPDAND
jgi:ABC-2 type transport system ATP-binding protein